jgi:Zn-dependent protease
MLLGLFIQTLASDPVHFVCVVFTVVFSITVHELAHGWAAMRLGDRTPQLTGHLTLDPLVHLGPMSLLMLALFGIAWGRMPIDPTRLRGKYAEALVAAAGPASNLALALIGLTAWSVWMAVEESPDRMSPFWRHFSQFLEIFGLTNLALMVFNLLPVPPLDGSHILANFSRSYARFTWDPANQGLMMLLFGVAFVLSGPLTGYAVMLGHRYQSWVFDLASSW